MKRASDAYSTITKDLTFVLFESQKNIKKEGGLEKYSKK